MRDSAESPKLSILHVLTLNGRNGEYGGPVRVARELCTELNSRGHSTHILSGARAGSEPIPEPGLAQSFILVKPLIKKLAVSSLWSWKLIKPLNKLITNADVVHIHFARDLIPMFAAVICILRRVPFVTQTHGMLDNQENGKKQIVDFLLAKKIFRMAKFNFVLNEIELGSMNFKFPMGNHKIIPNGIRMEKIVPPPQKSGQYKILFCSRLHPRKRPLFFIDLAKTVCSISEKYTFTLFGPDGGSLEDVKNSIREANIDRVSYKGSLNASQVLNVLSGFDLLILPSEKEPFPMVAIEAMSVGVPILIMKDCGIAAKLRNLPYKAICSEPSISEFITALESLEKIEFLRESEHLLLDLVNDEFNIESICEKVILSYNE